MAGMLFVIIALIVLFTGMGSIMLIGTKMKQDNDARTMLGGTDPDTLKRLADAVESLQGQVTDLSERMDFTERLLQAPKDTPDTRGGGSGG